MVMVKSPVASYNVEHTVAVRQRIELNIAKLFIKAALEAGYCLSVNDGEETVLKKSTDKTAIIKAMFSTDEDCLMVWKKGALAGQKDGKDVYFYDKQGWVQFTYGNDGFDVISDYTTNLEPLMTSITEYQNNAGF